MMPAIKMIIENQFLQLSTVRTVRMHIFYDLSRKSRSDFPFMSFAAGEGLGLLIFWKEQHLLHQANLSAEIQLAGCKKEDYHHMAKIQGSCSISSIMRYNLIRRYPPSQDLYKLNLPTSAIYIEPKCINMHVVALSRKSNFYCVFPF